VPLDEGAKRIVVALAGTGQDGCSFGRVHLNRLDGGLPSGLALFQAEGKGVSHVADVTRPRQTA
jgi:hypothetical protein